MPRVWGMPGTQNRAQANSELTMIMMGSSIDLTLERKPFSN